MNVDIKRRRELQRKRRHNTDVCRKHKRNGLPRTRRQNQATLGRECHGSPWTEQEIAKLWQPGQTAMEIANALRRSYHSVKRARSRFLARCPVDYVHIGNRRID